MSFLIDELVLVLCNLSVVKCYITIKAVIATFKSKDLKRFWESGQPRGINPNFAVKIRLILDTLNIAEVIEDMDAPGYGLHSLKGNRQGQWATTISRNWRITFKFRDGNAYDVDFVDYYGS